MNDATGSQSDFLRGCQLLELKRYADAEAAFRAVLAREPRQPWALHHLAFALWRQDRDADALPIALQAIGADPEESSHQVLRSHLLTSLRRPREALDAADEAIGIDPASADAFAAKAEALSGLARWTEGEQAAREALALNADHPLAHHHLAHTLRKQGRVHENAAVVGEQLRRDPESPLAHANAGWALLERGNHRKAGEHFAEALRLAPDFEWAREGLLQSFRARSRIYRAYLSYTFWMEKRRAAQQWAILIGLWLAVRFAGVVFTGELRWVGLAIAIGYIAFAFWVWVARGLGNLLIMGDRFARLVLRPAEKLEAVFVGGGLLAGIAIGTTGFVLENMNLMVGGALLTMAAIPLNCAFDNTRRLGRWLFGSIGTAAWFLALTAFSALILPARPASAATAIVSECWSYSLLACILTSWIGNLTALRKRQ